MKIKGERSISIEDGNHEGVVTSVEFTEQPFAYTEIFVQEYNSEVTLKVGMPTKITENTSLGELIKRVTGKPVVVGQEYDIEELLKGKKVKFVTVTEKTDKGKFARIIPESLNLA
jgi:hypothetical protein